MPVNKDLIRRRIGKIPDACVGISLGDLGVIENVVMPDFHHIQVDIRLTPGCNMAEQYQSAIKQILKSEFGFEEFEIQLTVLGYDLDVSRNPKIPEAWRNMLEMKKRGGVAKDKNGQLVQVTAEVLQQNG